MHAECQDQDTAGALESDALSAFSVQGRNPLLEALGGCSVRGTLRPEEEGKGAVPVNVNP